MATVPVPGSTMTVTQSIDVLDQLGLYTTPQHAQSKTVFYENAIWLETSSSSWRTIYNLYDYYWGKSGATRELSALPELMKRVSSCLMNHTFSNPELISLIDKTKKAKEGVNVLGKNQYLNQPEKMGFITDTLKVFEELEKQFQQKQNDLSKQISSQIQDHYFGEAQELKRQLEKLKQENAVLKLALETAKGNSSPEGQTQENLIAAIKFLTAALEKMGEKKT